MHRRLGALLALPALVLGLFLGAPTAASASEDNPLAGREWGVARSSSDLAWVAYQEQSGHKRKLLGRIALHPTNRWFGAWIPDDQIRNRVRSYIETSTGGDPDTVAMLTVFRMVPWEQDACRRLPTKAEKESYQRWIRRFADEIGDEQRAAVVLQPDGPFALCAPGGSQVLSRMVAWAAERLSRLDRTTTYIEIGSAGWNHLDPANAVRLLTRAGIENVRGFHMNTTHYESTERQIRFGSQVVDALAQAGHPGKHFTVDTAENGRPFTWQWFQDHHPGGVFNNAPVCRTRQQRHCVTLGIPPTTEVARPRWGLPEDVRAMAREDVDAYLWAGRPWLDTQSAPLVLSRALGMARTTPFQ